MKKSVVIIDPSGLHIRPASIVAKAAGQYKSKIEMIYKSKRANLKSILSVMTLGVKSGETVEIEANGDDAEAALDGIVASLKQNKLI